ncbi:MAG: hypothetical protein KBT27_07220 [Prevotellaceae bacterium]|nr:hypothetical protein [Candidatus Faecinaster equi]
MSKKDKSTVTNPNLSHERIFAFPVLAINTLREELSVNPNRYAPKELKRLLTDMATAFERMAEAGRGQNKNSDPGRVYAEQYEWVLAKLKEV